MKGCPVGVIVVQGKSFFTAIKRERRQQQSAKSLELAQLLEPTTDAETGWQIHRLTLMDRSLAVAAFNCRSRPWWPDARRPHTHRRVYGTDVITLLNSLTQSYHHHHHHHNHLSLLINHHRRRRHHCYVLRIRIVHSCERYHLRYHEICTRFKPYMRLQAEWTHLNLN